MTKCTDVHLDLHKLANVRRYILKTNCLTDAEKEQVLADTQRNESVTIEMNTFYNETDNTLKQSIVS